MRHLFDALIVYIRIEQPDNGTDEKLRAPGPYEDMNITSVTGVNETQKRALKALVAVEAAAEDSFASAQ